jgi:hypothetical protein
MPAEGDEINVFYVPGTREVELNLKGDPRFDWELRAAEKLAQDQARHDALLNGTVGKNLAVQGSEPEDEPSLSDLEGRHQRGELSDEQFATAVTNLFGG